jgi:hypothetical protein
MAAASLPTIIQDLPDALLGNAKHLSQCRYRLTFLVSCADFSITFALGESAIGDGEMREFQAAIRDRHRERHGERHLGE